MCRPLVDKFSILLWQARVGTGQGYREICERKGKGKKKAAGGMTGAPSMILHHWWLEEAL
jgi:hypothetical protein